MTATNAPAVSGQLSATRRPGLAVARLLRLELRHNAMLWMLPVAIALFWITTYRKTMAMPPMWNLRAASHAKRRDCGFHNTGGRRGSVDGVTGSPPPHLRPGDDLRAAAVGPPARHLGRHHLLGNSGLPGLPGRPVRGDRASG